MSNLTPAQRGVLRRLVESATSADCDVGMDVGVLKALLDNLEAVERECAQLQIALDGLSIAATQYSESRDRWATRARKLEATLRRYADGQAGVWARKTLEEPLCED